MSEEIKPAFYAVIPADVRYDSSLKPNAKLLYGEITALCNEKGYCWAGNDYFAKLYDVKPTTITTWVTELVNKKYLEREIVYEANTKQVKARILKLPMSYPLLDKNRVPSPINIEEGKTVKNTDTTTVSEALPLPYKKRGAPLQKSKENNTYEYIHEVFNNNEILKKNQNFIPLTVKWVTYKEKEKKQHYKTAESLTSWIKKLIKFSGGDLKIAEDIVETAMANLWEGIYKPDNYKFKPATVSFAPPEDMNQKYGGF